MRRHQADVFAICSPLPTCDIAVRIEGKPKPVKCAKTILIVMQRPRNTILIVTRRPQADVFAILGHCLLAV